MKTEFPRRSVGVSMVSGLEHWAAAIAAVPTSPAAAADWDHGHEHYSCNAETLRGDYGFTLTGTRPS